MLCEYGCNQEAKYQLKNGKWCCSEHTSQCPAIKEKNSTGLKQAHEKGVLSTKHFDIEGRRNWSKNKNCFNDNRIKAKTNDINDYLNNKLEINTYNLKKYLISLNILENKCDVCGISKWNDKDINLQLHHLDGNNKNNNLDNLQLLCPNCHSQTKNYAGAGRKTPSYLKNLNNNDLILLIKSGFSIADTIRLYNNKNNTCICISRNTYDYINKLCFENNITINKYGGKNKYIDKEKSFYINIEHKKNIIPSLNEAEEIAYKVNNIIDNVDLTKYGWVVKVSRIVGISKNKGRTWIKTWCPWLLENSYKRN